VELRSIFFCRMTLWLASALGIRCGLAFLEAVWVGREMPWWRWLWQRRCGASRWYLYGSPHAIEIFTDHHCLQYINARPNLSARQCRWVERTTRSRSTILLGIGTW
jgi:hypothetical protein